MLVVSKSQLELEKVAAAKAAGTAGPSSPPPPPGSPADKVLLCNACWHALILNVVLAWRQGVARR